jgi:uncharacterized protein
VRPRIPLRVFREAPVFRIAVDEIPESGMELQRVLAPAWVQPLVGTQFLGAEHGVKASFALNRAGRTVILRGQLAGDLRFVCSRCAEEAPWHVDHGFTHVFVEAAARSAKVPGEVDDDEDLEVTYYDGDVVDLEPLVAEELILALPAVPRCSEACKGICQQCGKNLNDGPCECHSDVVDPRWVRLKEIKL